ncbi:MAG: CaiB/BaiF CoA transferase family protein [Parasphingorhabdus sp.]
MTGPLAGITIVEFAGMGPVPFASMLMADMGADIIRIDRIPAGKDNSGQRKNNPMLRGRRSICLDLTQPSGRDVALRIVADADALVEGYRPGKMEKLGLGPEDCLKRNPALVYGRMTGWGQDGPYADLAGHDVNYIALAGALSLIGRKDAPPSIPLNLVGDYGGGALFLALGVLSALLESRTSGLGQVVDAAMIDGASSMLSAFHAMNADGRLSDQRGHNQLDSGAPHYNVYRTADDKWVSIGAIEPQFYQHLRKQLGLDDPIWDDQHDRSLWPEKIVILEKIFRSQSRQQWCDQMEGLSVCFAPVLTLDELPEHPHHVARESFVQRDGVDQPAPAPRFSRTSTQLSVPPVGEGSASADILTQIGVQPDEIEQLIAQGAVYSVSAKC